MKFLREVLEILQPWADAVVSGLARKPKGTRFPNGTPRVTAAVTGGSFSIGEAKDIPYCATADEINRYLRTEELALLLKDVDLSVTVKTWLPGDPIEVVTPESLKWDLPEDPFDPSDWLDDIEWDDWDEVGKTSAGDPVYIKPLSNGREHG